MTSMEFLGRRIYFKVKDCNSGRVLDVRFDRDIDAWNCTCKYWSIKQKECSHILKCKKLKGLEVKE